MTTVRSDPRTEPCYAFISRSRPWPRYTRGLVGPLQGPHTRLLPTITAALGAAGLFAERRVDDRYAAGLARLACTIGITAIAVTLYLSDF